MIVAGFGFRAGATPASLRDALARAGGGRPARLATLADKADHGGFAAFAGELGRPVCRITPQAAAAQATLTESPAARAAHGTGSVAEACALAAAGPGAALLGPRATSGDRMATCALAAAPGQGGPQ
jgi:cobalt-precorrin 5A hydrolase